MLKDLQGVTVCYVSTQAFGGVWRTYKQARTVADAGARVVIAGYESSIPAPFRADFELAVAKDRSHWVSNHRVWLIRVVVNLTVNRFANWLIDRHGALVSVVAAARPDVVVAVDLPSLAASYSVAKRLRAKLVYSAHEYWPGFVHNPNTVAVLGKRRIASLVADERRFISKADLVLAVGDQMGARLVGKYGIKSPLTILNSPNDRVEQPAPVSRPVRLVFHGQLSNPDRNVADLIRAMARLDGEATLDIHGSTLAADAAAVSESLTRLINELGLGSVVRLHGRFDYADVVDVVSRYDVGVMPARVTEENFEIALPNKILDSICAGLALAATDSDAIRALVEEAKCGVTIDTSSPETIARDIGVLVRDPQRIMEMKTAAVSAASRLWWPEQGRKLVDALGSLLDPRMDATHAC